LPPAGGSCDWANKQMPSHHVPPFPETYQTLSDPSAINRATFLTRRRCSRSQARHSAGNKTSCRCTSDTHSIKYHWIITNNLVQSFRTIPPKMLKGTLL
jgi:hypothetical protein